MAEYARLLGRLVHNLVTRVGEDLADCAASCRRGLVYKLRSFRRYDDVGPGGVQDFQLQPEQLARLVESVQSKPWFCELDRKAAQDLVHSGGAGCFVVRPSASTRSLTLTLWFHHRAYNILIRQREDGLLALGSKKNQEVTFRSVEEMVRHYEREPLILYSGGELTGRTRLRAPPPGLVGGRASVGSCDGVRRSSDGSNRRTALRTSSGSQAPFSSAGKRELSTSQHRSRRDKEHFKKCPGENINQNDEVPEIPSRASLKEGNQTFVNPKVNVSKCPIGSPTVSGRVVPESPEPGRLVTESPVIGRAVPGTLVSRRAVPGSPVSGRAVPETPMTGRVVPGSPVTGRAVPGTPVTGRLVPGSPVTGRAVPGTPVTGRVVPGSPVTGRAVTGSPVIGRAVPGTLVTGRAVPGTPVTGRAVLGTPVTERAVPGTLVTGRAVPGTPVTGRAVLGTPVTGRAVLGTLVTGKAVPGTPVIERVVPGSPVTGRAVTGSPVIGRAVPGTPVTEGVVPEDPVPGRTVPETPVTERVMPGSPVTGRAVTGSPVIGRAVPGTPVTEGVVPEDPVPGRTVPERAAPSLGLSVVSEPNVDSACL